MLARLGAFAAFLGLALATVLTPSIALASSDKGDKGIVRVDGVDMSGESGSTVNHTGCDFNLKWLNFGKGEKGDTLISTVAFAVTYPSGVPLSMDGPASVVLDKDKAGGSSDLDADQSYRLSFYAPPYSGNGYKDLYIVKLTVATPGSDTRQMYFMVSGCAQAAPAMQLTKTVADSNDADTIGSLGETLTYSFTVKNTGNVPLTNVKITDPTIPALASGATCAATLAAGATTTCPSLPAAAHVVNIEDINRGTAPNSATSTATPPQGSNITSAATASMSTPATPSILLTKAVADSNDADSIGSLGETLTYSFTVKNTGNVALSNVKITDAMIPALANGATCIATLAAGATTTCPSLPAATHVVNAEDITRGTADNTATGTGTPPTGANVTSQASATIATPATPSIEMTKAVADSNDADSIGSLGETLTYSFTVKNTGNVALSNVKITDAMIPALASGATCVSALAAGATSTCPSLPAATHVVSTEDIARGSVANSAAAAATPPKGANVTSNASATIATPAVPAISMTKSVADANADNLASEGEKLTYAFTVTNAGNVPLTGVKITDAMIPALASGASCVATLAVGASTTCPTLPAATHVVTGAEAAKSSLVNTATSAAVAPSGSSVTSQASASITTQPTNAAITMTKSVADSNDADSIGSLGETLTYSFTVKNTGNIALSNVKITDAMIPALANGATCVATLAAGATTTCPSLPAATHVVNAEDINRGTVVNTATGTATPPSGSNVTALDTATIATPAAPGFTMTKVVADSDDVDSIGSLAETLTYSFSVTNTGNVPLTGVKITDPMIPALASGATCVATLAVGASTTCPTLPAATHVVNAEDIGKGRVDNTATTTGTTPSGSKITTTGSATITAPAAPALKLVKSVSDSNDADSIGSLGETLTYSFTVKNTGNVPLTNVKITDAMIPGLANGATCVATLAVGATTTCPTLPAATHVVNAEDIAHGTVDNTASAAATPPSGTAVTSPSSATIASPAAPGFTMSKTVTDSDDADNLASEGEKLTYSFSVKNTGNVPLTNVKVTDAMIPSLVNGAVCVATLAVGATTTCPSLPAATHVVTFGEAAKGSFTNDATGSASAPSGTDLGTRASATIGTIASKSSITMTKTVADSNDADVLASEDEPLTYRFTVSNTGNVPLTKVMVTDKMIPALADGALCVADLPVGTTTTCPGLSPASYTVTAADVTRNTIDNTATSRATPANGDDVAAKATASIETKPTPPPAPSIALAKTVTDSDDADKLASEGEKLTYGFSVKNTGNVPLTKVTITDKMIPALADGALCVQTLAVGVTTTCPALPAATYTVTASDVTRSTIDNTASSTATSAKGTDVTAKATASIETKPTPPPADPSIGLTKTVTDSADADELASEGEKLTYGFTVKNTGNVALEKVTISDKMIPALADGALCVETLAVGASTTCPALPEATHVVTAQEAAQNSVDNTATAEAVPPSGSGVTSTDTARIETDSAPPAPDASIAMTKSVTDSDDADKLASEGEQLTYTFTVTNTGKAALTGVTLTDPMIPALANGAPCTATLAVGETTKCPDLPTATYLVSAKDVDRGSIVNIASSVATPELGKDVMATASVVLGTYKETTTEPGPFSWDWKYDDPSCTALTVAYPSNIPDGQANDVNIRLQTNLGEITLNFHNNEGFWGGTTSFPYASHRNWPAGITSYSVVWTQVGGTNYHWQGNVKCLINDDGDPTTVDNVLGVTSILGWRTSTVTVKQGAILSADAVSVRQSGEEDLVLQRLTGGAWADLKTVAVNDGAARVTFGRQTTRGTFKYRLAVTGSSEVTGATTNQFIVRVR